MRPLPAAGIPGREGGQTRLTPRDLITSDTVMARWPGGQVRLSEVDALRRPGGAGWFGWASPEASPREWTERAALMKRLEEAARDRGFANDPARLTMERRFEDQRLYDLTYEKEMQSVPVPGPEEVEQARKAEAEKKSASGIWFRYIYIDLSGVDPEQARQKRERAERAALRAAEGVDFESLAAQISDLPPPDRGRVFGPVRRGQILPEVEDVLFSLEPGKSSKVIDTRTALHIVQTAPRRRDRRFPDPKAETEAIRDALMLQRRARRRETLLEELHEKYPTVISETLATSPTVVLSGQPEATVLRVGPWAMTAEELRDAVLERGIPAPDGDAVLEYARELVDRRLFILHGISLDRQGQEGKKREENLKRMALLFFTMDELARERRGVSEEDVDAYYLRHLSDFMKPITAITRQCEVMPAGRGKMTTRRSAADQEKFPDLDALRQAMAASSALDPIAKDLKAKDFSLRVRERVPIYFREGETGAGPGLEMLDQEYAQPGQVYPPIPRGSGWVVIQALSVVAPQPWPLKEIRPLVRREAERQALWEGRAAVREELLKDVVFEAAAQRPSPR